MMNIKLTYLILLISLLHMQNISGQFSIYDQAKALSNLQNGIGGTTIVNFTPEGNNVIVIKNKKRYRCNGHIYKANCNGNLKEITTYFDDLSFCIAPFYKVVKNPLDNSLDYCIALTDNSISPKRNGVLECTDRNGNINNTLLISRNLYIKKCKTGIDEAALFTYYPDYKSKEFVELPSKFIKCFNGESKNSCTYLWNPRNVLFH